jgi:hypothetical protein
VRALRDLYDRLDEWKARASSGVPNVRENLCLDAMAALYVREIRKTLWQHLGDDAPGLRKGPFSTASDRST